MVGIPVGDALAFHHRVVEVDDFVPQYAQLPTHRRGVALHVIGLLLQVAYLPHQQAHNDCHQRQGGPYIEPAPTPPTLPQRIHQRLHVLPPMRNGSQAATDDTPGHHADKAVHLLKDDAQ